MVDTAAHISLSVMVERIADLANADLVLLRRGRHITTDIVIEIGDLSYSIAIDHGRVAAIRRGPLIMSSWSFAVRGGEGAWRAFWLPFPPPHFHDLFALAKHGSFRIEGNFRVLMTNLLYFKGLISAPRTLESKVQMQIRDGEQRRN